MILDVSFLLLWYLWLQNVLEGMKWVEILAIADLEACVTLQVSPADSGTTILTGVSSLDSGCMGLNHACSGWRVACLSEAVDVL